jgi:hypothetical protein
LNTESNMGLAMLKHILTKIRELLNLVRIWNLPPDRSFYRVRYTSVPLWKPWRDF